MKKHINFAIIGGGSWATALAKILCESVSNLHWYMRNEKAIEFIQKEKHNPNYLTTVKFDTDQLHLTSDINEVVEAAKYILLIIPSAFVSTELKKLHNSLHQKIIFSGIKGIIPESGMVVGDHLENFFDVAPHNFGVIAGPCHAEEVARERLSYLTVASSSTKKAKILAEILDNSYIRCMISRDVKGIEYATLLKNIYAIAAGIYHGLGYGDNFQSVLMSNSIREMERFIKKNTRRRRRDIKGSAYLGDLLVTGYSSFSRNRTLGNMIGKGYTVKNAQLEMNMIAEGYYAAKTAHLINQQQKNTTDAPIIDAVYKILYQQEDPKETMFKLTRSLT